MLGVLVNPLFVVGRECVSAETVSRIGKEWSVFIQGWLTNNLQWSTSPFSHELVHTAHVLVISGSAGWNGYGSDTLRQICFRLQTMTYMMEQMTETDQ